MKKAMDKTENHGRSLYDWLDSYYILSLDGYYNPHRMNLETLHVLDDDRIAPNRGFGTHPHKNMEIITIPSRGRLQHGDSKQNRRTTTPGYIQTMSTSTDIYRSEVNGSDAEEMEPPQIRMISKELNTPPAYQDYDIRSYLHKNEPTLIVSPDGNAPAKMLQQTWFSIGEAEAGRRTSYHLHQPHAGVYIFLIENEIKVGSTALSRRDGMGVYETNSLEIETLKDSHILLMEVSIQGFCVK